MRRRVSSIAARKKRWIRTLRRRPSFQNVTSFEPVRSVWRLRRTRSTATSLRHFIHHKNDPAFFGRSTVAVREHRPSQRSLEWLWKPLVTTMDGLRLARTSRPATAAPTGRNARRSTTGTYMWSMEPNAESGCTIYTAEGWALWSTTLAPSDPLAVHQEGLHEPDPWWPTCSPWTTWARPLLENVSTSRLTRTLDTLRPVCLRLLLPRLWQLLETGEETDGTDDYKDGSAHHLDTAVHWRSWSLPPRRQRTRHWKKDKVLGGVPAWIGHGFGNSYRGSGGHPSLGECYGRSWGESCHRPLGETTSWRSWRSTSDSPETSQEPWSSFAASAGGNASIPWSKWSRGGGSKELPVCQLSHVQEAQPDPTSKSL